MNKEKKIILSLFALIYWFYWLCGILLCLLIFTLAILGFSYLEVQNAQGVICFNFIGLLLIMFMCKLIARMLNRYMADE